MASAPAVSPPAHSGSKDTSPPPPESKSSPPPPSPPSPPPSPPASPPPTSPPPSPPSSPPPASPPPSPPPASPPPAPPHSPPPHKDNPPPSPSPPSPPSSPPPSKDSPSTWSPSPPPPTQSDTPVSQIPPSQSPPTTSPTTPANTPSPPSKTPSPPANTPSPPSPTFAPPTPNRPNTGYTLPPPNSAPQTPPSSSTQPLGPTPQTNNSPSSSSLGGPGSTSHSVSVSPGSSSSSVSGSPGSSSSSVPGSSGSLGSNISHPHSNSQTSVVIVAGLAIAGIVVVAFIVLCVICLRKKKKQPYYLDPGCPPKEQYYNGVGQWQNSQPVDHIVKVSPPPGVMGTPVGGPSSGWVGPPAPVVANTSGEYSSGLSGQNLSPMPPQSPIGALGGFSQSQFSYDALATATGGFSQANLLGQGGFGYVHKGVLPDGKIVAVKSLKSGSGQGEREFQAEVEIISRIHHRHLVSLVGYCITEGQRMLVYEFVDNKTLEFHLHGKGQPVMDWSTRLRIALGSAKGLAYLHEDCHPRIIHRDIKAANILIDHNFEAMVADFGLAKLTSDNFTHVSTRVMGTFGYMAPEYASSGKLTEKSDVFSFGVMLLELITGRRPIDTTNKVMEDSLVDWARPLLSKAMEDGNHDALVDPRLEGNFNPDEMARMASCAAASIRHSARRRPKMSQIVRSLEGDLALDDLSEGVKPGQSVGYSPASNGGYDTGAYNADMMKFKKMVMSDQELTSSEYGGTNDYGLNQSTSSGNSRDMDNSGPRSGKNFSAA